MLPIAPNNQSLTFLELKVFSGCGNCPPYSISQQGSNNILDCKCMKGYYKEDILSSVCGVCAANTYKNNVGNDNTDCKSCAMFATSPEGSTHVNDCMCPDNFFVDGNACSLCSQGNCCLAGEYLVIDSVTKSKNCHKCMTNSSSEVGSNGKDDCKCNPGATGEDGSHCNLCDTGKYKTSIGSTPCTSCVQGKYSDEIGSSLEATCQTCPMNTTDNIYGVCRCMPGFEMIDFMCNECAPGKYKFEISNNQCKMCPNNTYSEKNGAFSVNDCRLCPSDSYSILPRNSITNCICNSGFTIFDQKMCKMCIKGKYKIQSGNQECTSCPPGTYSIYNGSVFEQDCIKCPLNSISLSSSRNVQDCKCNAGSTGPDGGSCIKCESAKYKDNLGNNSCKLCILQSTSAFGSSSISQCKCNSGSNGTARFLCEFCRAGTYKESDLDAPCDMCPTGKYSSVIGATTQSICQSCPLYSTSIPGTMDFENCNCALGFNMSGKVCVAITSKSELNAAQFYVSFSFNIDINVVEINTEILNNIRQKTADEYKIQLIRVGLLKFKEQKKSTRRLFSLKSLSASFTILSFSSDQGNKIKHIVSLSKINSILSNSFNKTITISNFEKSAIYDISTTNYVIYYVVSFVIGVVLLTLTVLCILNKCKHQKYSVIPENFDASMCTYYENCPT